MHATVTLPVYPRHEAFDYDAPLADAPTCNSQIRQAWARVPESPSLQEADRLKDDIRTLLRERQAVLVAHYYVIPELQDLALETGGCVGDSLEMARFGARHPAQTLLVAGVRFMGESAKILCPDKTVLMPDLAAECSLDLGCPADEFSAFCDQHPDRTVVVYANTSAQVKARVLLYLLSFFLRHLLRSLQSRRHVLRLLYIISALLLVYLHKPKSQDLLRIQ